MKFIWAEFFITFECSQGLLGCVFCKRVKLIFAMENFNLLISTLSQDGIHSGVLQEAVYLGAVLLTAWTVAWALGRQIKTESVLFANRVVDGLMFPLLALLLAYFAVVLLLKNQNVVLFKLAVPVLLSLALIR